MRHVRHCPRCGSALPDEVAKEIGGWSCRRLYQLVRDAGPEGIHTRDLADKLYSDRPDGGPSTANSCIKVMVWRINQRIAPMGVAIVCGTGYSYYRLIKKERKRKR